ncbi:ATP-binding cassette sub- B member 6 [Mactra antiquata]
MLYCSNGTEFTNIWLDEGINHCFLNTITSSVLFLLIFIFGSVQNHMYNKYSTKIEAQYVRTNFGSVLQVILTVLLITESVSHIVMKDLMKEKGGVVGVDVLTFFSLFLSWLFSLKLLSLERKSMLPTIPTRGHGLLLLTFWTLAFLRENLAFISWWSHDWWWYFESDADHGEFVLWVIRYTSTALLFIIGFKAPGLPKTGYRLLQLQDEENKGGNSSTDTSVNNSGPTVHTGSTWSNVWKKLKLMLPYVWPKGSLWRQAIVAGCIIILAAGRGINVFVPLYNKYIVNSLTYDQKQVDDPGMFGAQTLQFRWDFICIYSLLLFFKGSSTGGSGFLNNMRTFLWIPVQQYTTRRVQVKLFGHLHSLSLSWHLKRKTGEILRVVDRGTNSINNLLNYVLFQIIPTIIDIIIAIVYFVTAFNYIFGLVVFIAMVMYLSVTVYITEWRTKYKRDMNRLDNATNSTAVDSLLNFETVKYYGASEFEIKRYNEAILKYQKAEWKATASLNLLNTAQNIVITAGILSGSLLCAWAVVHSLNGLHLTVGDYVLFGTYIIQLYGPLNFLGTYYRMIQTAFIDMENMFELLDVGVEVSDVPGAKDLQIKNGEIVFKDVEFRYHPEKPILKGISFTVPAGQTYALVGHSGSGKSTIIRLLFRFYDIEAGKITIDGEDISKVKQESLRQCIGVVPQDTVLFNNDILYNIRYGRITGTDDEVHSAANSADIHQRILSFPNKYETMVGERGLKLSGGEKQRVAIARTLLKDPHIVLLDEATSALDTKTERNIQSSLSRVCQNRTTIIVAHRLSTIIHADMILVLDEGEIVERGTHEELLQTEGQYYEMWQQQLTKLEDNGDNNSINGENVVEADVKQDKS